MRTIITFLFASFVFTPIAQAEIGDIGCWAIYKKTVNNTTVEDLKEPMVNTLNINNVVRFEGAVKGRDFALSGNVQKGDFVLSQVWGKNYEQGEIGTTGFNFNSDGRLQISQVITTKSGADLTVELYKLECSKVLASQFPNQ